MEPLAGPDSPLESDLPMMWDGLIEAVGPASMLVAIHGRMSAELRARYAPEDVWQEALLHAWRDREQCRWSGVPGFRRWLLSVAENRLRDLADREGAAKRGAGRAEVPLSVLSGSDGGAAEHYAGPVATTTPSRAALDAEKAAEMLSALDGLPSELRDVVRLRLFEDLTLEEVAVRLRLGVEGTRHRFRKGAELYYKHISSVLESAQGRQAKDRDG